MNFAKQKILVFLISLKVPEIDFEVNWTFWGCAQKIGFFGQKVKNFSSKKIHFGLSSPGVHLIAKVIAESVG